MKAKDNAVIKRVCKKEKVDAKKSFGNAVIAASDNNTKRKRDDDDDGDVIDISNPKVHLSAAYLLENKTPVEADTAP